MKKVLVLPIFAIAALFSQAVACGDYDSGLRCGDDEVAPEEIAPEPGCGFGSDCYTTPKQTFIDGADGGCLRESGFVPWGVDDCWDLRMPGPGGEVMPIIKPTSGVALNVVPFGRSLHISSAKDATVSLYGISGAKVYSGKVLAGNSVFSLEKVPSGSYYAIVRSGSDSKLVKLPIP
jgi:hypothetical protein